jgi:gliding motility-associated-like protein
MITIIEEDDPSFSYTGTSICEGDANALATITGLTGGSFTSSPAGLVINGSTGEVDVASSTLDISYTITYTTTGVCPSSQDATLIINTAPTTTTVTTNFTGNTICLGESIDLSASVSGTNITYNVYDALTGGTLLGSTDLTVSPTTTTDYYIEALNIAGCSPLSGREPITVTVNSLPLLGVNSDEDICLGDSITLIASGTGTFSWSTTATTASISVSPLTTTQYEVTLTDANLCESMDSILVSVTTINGSIVAEDDSYTVSQGVIVPLDILSNDTYSGNNINIIVPSLNGTGTLELDGTITYLSNEGFEGVDSIVYTICSDLCISLCDTGTVEIDVESNTQLVISGGFSPNGDNINDIFMILGLEKYPNNNLTVFNRWGSLVYQSAPYNNDWDGKSSGKGVLIGDKVTTGTYFYILELDESTEVIRGSLEIKR